MDIEILPRKFSGASFLRGAMAVEGTTDFQGIGRLTTVEYFTPVEFQCQWEPYVTENGLIIVYFCFPSQQSFLVTAIEDFLDRIRVI